MDLGLSTGEDGMPTVVIMREKDGALLVVDVDDGSGGIGFSSKTKPGTEAQTQIQPDML